jgi:hypothetical protein
VCERSFDVRGVDRLDVQAEVVRAVGADGGSAFLEQDEEFRAAAVAVCTHLVLSVLVVDDVVARGVVDMVACF